MFLRNVGIYLQVQAKLELGKLVGSYKMYFEAWKQVWTDLGVNHESGFHDDDDDDYSRCTKQPLTLSCDVQPVWPASALVRTLVSATHYSQTRPEIYYDCTPSAWSQVL